MIIYITGASASGKTTLLQKIPIKGYDLDDVYESNWEKYKTITAVQKGVKKDIDELISKQANIVFVGLQGTADLTFKPDLVFILVRTDYEKYYRQKLIRDLNLLCENKKEFEEVLAKEPFDEFRNHFWSNDIVNMKSFGDFKLHVEKMNNSIQKDFPKAEILTADKIINKLTKLK